LIDEWTRISNYSGIKMLKFQALTKVAIFDHLAGKPINATFMFFVVFLLTFVSHFLPTIFMG
ncbi:MAG: hypothetical protein AABY26_02415, partial [Nanoarchaeota archaeon]